MDVTHVARIDAIARQLHAVAKFLDGVHNDASAQWKMYRVAQVKSYVTTFPVPPPFNVPVLFVVAVCRATARIARCCSGEGERPDDDEGGHEELSRNQHFKTPFSTGVSASVVTPSPSNPAERSPRRRKGSSQMVMPSLMIFLPISSRKNDVPRAIEVPVIAPAKWPNSEAETRG